ncbi:hypothetical protein [Paracoccus sp. ME4]|uniref:hypothetical protein n=1 Tax=Paracoccus sp. ME4 TaxID=3138066 RepID=UPI00398B55DD
MTRTIVFNLEPGAQLRQAAKPLSDRPPLTQVAPAPQTVSAPPPPVRRISTNRRRLRCAIVFGAMVLAPTALTGVYLWGFAQDRYRTGFSFSVRSQQAQSMGGGMAAMAAMSGAGGGASDAGVVADFLAGREVVERMMSQGIPLSEILSLGHDQDPIFSLAPDAAIEEVEAFWGRVAHVERDPQTGIVRFGVTAADRDASLRLARAALGQADVLVNELSERAVRDATRVAGDERARAETRAEEARAALQAFRSKHSVVDPAVEYEGRMSVLTGMRQKLSDTLIQRAGVLGVSSDGEADARVRALDLQIRNLREAIAAETELVGARDGHALIASGYERAVSDLAFAEEAWRAAIAGEDMARKEADARRAYLAVHAEPRAAGISVTPNRWQWLAIVFGGCVTLWAFLALMATGMRDRR